ncbi:hypothetical protein MHYP_G00013540 [Metynnis hypsauchen]
MNRTVQNHSTICRKQTLFAVRRQRYPPRHRAVHDVHINAFNWTLSSRKEQMVNVGPSLRLLPRRAERWRTALFQTSQRCHLHPQSPVFGEIALQTQC